MTTTSHRLIRPGTCWWCDAGTANSAEHKFKRSDLARDFGRGAFLADGGLAEVSGRDNQVRRIQGPSSRRLKFLPVLCARCNNTRSQPFDRAYDCFIEWVMSHEIRVLTERKIDLEDVFGPQWRPQTDDVRRYFVKHVGCRLAECAQRYKVYVGADLIAFLDGGSWPATVTAELFIDPSYQRVCDELRAAGENPAWHALNPIWAELRQDTSTLVGIQSRWSNRWLRFAWQVDGLERRSPPMAERIVRLPAIDTVRDARRAAASGAQPPTSEQ